MDHSYSEKLAVVQACVLYRQVGRPNIDSVGHQEVDSHLHILAWIRPHLQYGSHMPSPKLLIQTLISTETFSLTLGALWLGQIDP